MRKLIVALGLILTASQASAYTLDITPLTQPQADTNVYDTTSTLVTEEGEETYLWFLFNTAGVLVDGANAVKASPLATYMGVEIADIGEYHFLVVDVADANISDCDSGYAACLASTAYKGTDIVLTVTE